MHPLRNKEVFSSENTELLIQTGVWSGTPWVFIKRMISLTEDKCGESGR